MGEPTGRRVFPRSCGWPEGCIDLADCTEGKGDGLTAEDVPRGGPLLRDVPAEGVKGLVPPDALDEFFDT
jgi:hypothetical protein